MNTLEQFKLRNPSNSKLQLKTNFREIKRMNNGLVASTSTAPLGAQNVIFSHVNIQQRLSSVLYRGCWIDWRSTAKCLRRLLLWARNHLDAALLRERGDEVMRLLTQGYLDRSWSNTNLHRRSRRQ